MTPINVNILTVKQYIRQFRKPELVVLSKGSPFLTVLLLILLIFADAASAGTPESLVLKESKIFSDKGIKAIAQGDDPKAMICFTKAEAIAQKINIGRIYCFLSNYGDALGYYKQALDIKKRNPECAI